jgi:hypothetical protein
MDPNASLPHHVVVPLDDESIARLMVILCDTRDDEFSCEEVFGRLDEYVDCILAQRDVGSERPLLEHHLERCVDCRDELEALVHALESAVGDDRANTPREDTTQ